MDDSERAWRVKGFRNGHVDVRCLQVARKYLPLGFRERISVYELRIEKFSRVEFWVLSKVLANIKVIIFTTKVKTEMFAETSNIS
jgi:hypothetical protein